MSRSVDPSRRCLPIAEWPEPDRAAWQVALQAPDAFNPLVGNATGWKVSTRKLVVNGYGRWLGWLQQNGALDHSVLPAERATRDHVRLYVAALKAAGLADYSVTARVAQLGDALRALAPEGDWKWIGRGAARIGSSAVPVRDVTSRMRPPEEILELGLDLMEAAESDRFRTDRERATLYRDGLVLGLLVMRPMRVQNIAGLVIGRTLERRGERWWLSFREGEMKGVEAFEAPWPDLLTPLLARYLKVHRPELLKCATRPKRNDSDLWISRRGGRMTVGAVTFQVIDRTRAEFGEGINPHTFRHIAATTIASVTPDNVTDIASVLGHTSLDVSEKHYTKARTVLAGRAYQETISSLRRNARNL